jgi:hypothetical protein
MLMVVYIGGASIKSALETRTFPLRIANDAAKILGPYLRCNTAVARLQLQKTIIWLKVSFYCFHSARMAYFLVVVKTWTQILDSGRRILHPWIAPPGFN